MSANDKQIAGDHYKQYGNLQPWDVIIAWNMNYLTGTALKYLARWRDKGGIDDLKKAIHFIEKQIEVAEAEQAAAASKRERYLFNPATGEKVILPNS